MNTPMNLELESINFDNSSIKFVIWDGYSSIELTEEKIFLESVIDEYCLDFTRWEESENLISPPENSQLCGLDNHLYDFLIGCYLNPANHTPPRNIDEVSEIWNFEGVDKFKNIEDFDCWFENARSDWTAQQFTTSTGVWDRMRKIVVAESDHFAENR